MNTIPPREMYCDQLDDDGPGCSLPFDHEGSCVPHSTGCRRSVWCTAGPGHVGACDLAAAHRTEDDVGMLLSFPKAADGRRAMQRAAILYCADLLDQHGAAGHHGAQILRACAARVEMGFPASPPAFRDLREEGPPAPELEIDDATDRVAVPEPAATFS
jgi:hypothetical protein